MGEVNFFLETSQKLNVVGDTYSELATTPPEIVLLSRHGL